MQVASYGNSQSEILLQNLQILANQTQTLHDDVVLSLIYLLVKCPFQHYFINLKADN